MEKPGQYNHAAAVLVVLGFLYSLLDILAGRKNKKGLMGTVLINGQEQPRNFKCISGYVVQVNWATCDPIYT